MWDFITQIVFQGLGALVKKLLGQPISRTGVSEMWLGAAIAAVVVVGIVAGVHYGR